MVTIPFSTERASRRIRAERNIQRRIRARRNIRPIPLHPGWLSLTPCRRWPVPGSERPLAWPDILRMITRLNSEAGLTYWLVGRDWRGTFLACNPMGSAIEMSSLFLSILPGVETLPQRLTPRGSAARMAADRTESAVQRTLAALDSRSGVDFVFAWNVLGVDRLQFRYGGYYLDEAIRLLHEIADWGPLWRIFDWGDDFHRERHLIPVHLRAATPLAESP